MQNQQSNNNQIIHLDTLNVGDSFHIPNSKLMGTVIKHGQMGVRVIIDGCIRYSNDGKQHYERRVEIIGNKTECVINENKYRSEQLGAITRMGYENSRDSREAQTSEV